jgi:chorismate mutase
MENLETLREELSEIDDTIIELIMYRRQLSKRISIVKNANNLPYINKASHDFTNAKYNNALGILGRDIYYKIHIDSLEIQKEL